MKPQQLSVAIVVLAVLSVVVGLRIKPKYGLDINGGARVVLEALYDPTNERVRD